MVARAKHAGGNSDGETQCTQTHSAHRHTVQCSVGLRADGIVQADGGWSTGEFVHALALIATGNLLGMMASGCGATQEVLRDCSEGMSAIVNK